MGRSQQLMKFKGKSEKSLETGGLRVITLLLQKVLAGLVLSRPLRGLIAKAEGSKIKPKTLLVLGFPRTTSKRLVTLLPECH